MGRVVEGVCWARSGWAKRYFDWRQGASQRSVHVRKATETNAQASGQKRPALFWADGQQSRLLPGKAS